MYNIIIRHKYTGAVTVVEIPAGNALEAKKKLFSDTIGNWKARQQAGLISLTIRKIN